MKSYPETSRPVTIRLAARDEPGQARRGSQRTRAAKPRYRRLPPRRQPAPLSADDPVDGRPVLALPKACLASRAVRLDEPQLARALGDVQTAAPGCTEMVPPADHGFRAQFRAVRARPGKRSFRIAAGNGT